MRITSFLAMKDTRSRRLWPAGGGEGRDGTLADMGERRMESSDPDQAYFWTDEWQEGERLADRDRLNGDCYKPTDIDDLIAWLNDNEADESP